MKFDDLPDDAKWFMNELIEQFLDKNGTPPGMSRGSAKDALIWLFEHGKACVIAHGEMGTPDCTYSIQVDEEFARS